MISTMQYTSTYYQLLLLTIMLIHRSIMCIHALGVTSNFHQTWHTHLTETTVMRKIQR